MEIFCKKIELRWISIYKVIFFICFCLACPLWGQADKNAILTSKDYKLWHTLVPLNISNNGEWTSYGLFYDVGEDTLVIEGVRKKEKYLLPNAFFNHFSPNSKWVFSRTNDYKLWLLNLETGKQRILPHVKYYQPSPDSKTIAYLANSPEERKEFLIVENLIDGTTRTFSNVFEFKYNSTGHYIAFSQNENEVEKVVVLDLEEDKEYELHNNRDKQYSNIVWTNMGKGLVFFQGIEDNNNLIHYFRDVTERQGKIFDPRPQKLEISTNRSSGVQFSVDGKKLFFYASNVNEKDSSYSSEEQKADVEVWNTKDELLYPGYGHLKKSNFKPTMGIALQLKSGNWKYVGDTIHTISLFGTDAKYVYSYSHKEHSLSYTENESPSTIDVYNVETGVHKAVVKKPHNLEFQMSPSGRFLAYFHDKNWWIYDAQKDLYTNVTEKLNVEFYDSKSNKSVPFRSFGNPGWSIGEEEIILYDEFDLWTISPDGSKAKKITHGRESSLIYRVYRFGEGRFESPKFVGQYAKEFDLKEGVILTGRNNYNEHTGYFNYSSEGVLDTIIYKNRYLKDLRLSKEKNAIIYTEEDYGVPLRLMYHAFKNASPILLEQSNSQHFKYKWGHSELVYYTTQKGDSLKGALFYPADFNPNNKYPMITFCYESLSKKLHHYQNPTLHNSIGFSVSNYTTNGYFVFFPDIVYEIGDPGLSALECITSGVREVLKLPFINGQKLGLYGHSFGGYETMFVITQTDIFATAIAGAGASNMLSFYLSMAWLWDRPQYWRFEKQQWRMGDSYFNIPEKYERNSPIHQLTNVKTPLLTWAGKQDTNVNWEQQVEMFLGLRKLNKEHSMLLYPSEGHDVVNPLNQIDLTRRMAEWFDHYLKDKPPANWMTNPH